MRERVFVICVGFLLDLMFGDPRCLYHPVRGIGALTSRTEKYLWRLFRCSDVREAERGKKRAAGLICVLFVLLLSIGIPLLLLKGASAIHPYLRTALSCFWCGQLLAVKSLKTESMKVYRALELSNLSQARLAVSMIVGRDTEQLDEAGIERAAVETVAENTSDGVVAPLCFWLLFGVPGGFFYKAVNTMDSMMGYKNDRYCYFGTAAAKLDDVCNFIPARLAAVLMIAASFLLGYDTKNALRIYRRDRKNHASPNSAQTEAVCAGALSIQLAGDACYFGQVMHKPTIGDNIRQIEPEDIVRANRLLYATSFLAVFAGVLLLNVAGLMK